MIPFLCSGDGGFHSMDIVVAFTACRAKFNGASFGTTQNIPNTSYALSYTYTATLNGYYNKLTHSHVP